LTGAREPAYSRLVCTLILGRDVLAPDTVLIAANRDEDPSRGSDPPGVLNEWPRVVGGRDRVARGTWLAVRERRAVIALLNRYDPSARSSPAPADRRSRGLLTLDVATVDEHFGKGTDSMADPELARLRRIAGKGLPFAALCRALAAIREARYAAFALVFASPTSCWVLTLEGDGSRRVEVVPQGWHVLTHADLDDREEPRTARLLDQLRDERPRSIEKAEQRLGDLLRSHGTAGEAAVCLHEGRMVTVSSSLVWLALGEARYRHAEGRPCEHPFTDYSHLLDDPHDERESA